MRKKSTKSILFLFFLLMSFLNYGQVNVQAPAADFIKRSLQSAQIEKNLSEKDLSDYAITDNYINRLTGAQHVYLRQVFEGYEIMGTESAIHIKNDGSLLVAHSRFENSLEKRRLGSNAPTLTAVDAVQAAASQLGYQMTGSLHLLSQENTVDKKSVISTGGISLSEIPARLMYFLNEEGNLILVWDLSIEHTGKLEWYNVQVDATTGEIVNKINWVNSCNFSHTHSHDEEEAILDTNHYIEAECIETSVEAPLDDYAALLTGSYRVIELPLESPLFGARTLVNGATAVNTTASPYGWHDTNGVIGPEYTITRGNNVNAYEDTDNNNTPGFQPDGGPSLVFDYPFNPIYSSGDPSQAAAITNLFYWSNIIHDITYMYGFDEVSGNFQANNYGNGGLGNDFVRAEAQDGSGTCNANFATPADGSQPRMQMYVCGNRDGDFDNLVIIHEYGHGISNRMTGGPGTSGCLNNQEQMGEGWSDWYGLMFTMQPGDEGTDSRGVGTYLIGEDIGGGGIRTYPYSTDMSINPHTYDDIKVESVPHGVGSVWAAMLWEMTWGLIDAYGFDPDIYSGTGGNNIALALVTEGLRLQPCNPGFVDGRDAILLADENLYGGANVCIIWEAFAKRGLGLSAIQGSSNSRSDGTEAFDTPASAAEMEAFGEICDSAGIQTGLGGGTPTGGVYSGPGVTDNGNGLTYTFDPNVAGIGVHTITYTLPANECFSINEASDTIEVRPGMEMTYCPTDIIMDADPTNCDLIVNYTNPQAVSGCTGSEFENFDLVTAPTLPGGWTMTQEVNTGINWVTTSTMSSSSPNSAFANNPNYVNLSSLVSPTYLIGSAYAKLKFDLFHITENVYDGMVLEYSSDGGITWQDILLGGGVFNSGGYNGVISDCCSNPLENRAAWTGNSGGFKHVEVDLNPALVGLEVIFRWRLGTDNQVGASGVWLDNVSVTGVAYTEPLVTLVSGIPSGGAFPVGTTTNVFEISDGSGNVLTCSFDVTIVDVTNPEIDAMSDVVIDANTNCEGVLPDFTSIAVVQDNCDPNPSVTQSPAPGTAVAGPTTVTLTVTDEAGNSASTSFEVTVEDNSPPVVITQNIMAPLDVNGQVTITAEDIDNGSWDNCEIASMSVSPDSFTCNQIGPHTVTLTVTDVNGHTASATAQVNVADVMPPDAVAQDITVVLGPNGTVNITPAQLDAGTTDNCSIASISIFPSSFTCNNIGPNNVNFEVFDTSGNSTAITVVVTVVDETSPEINCPDDYTVAVVPGGTYSLPDYWDTAQATADDACTEPVTDLTQDPAPGTELAVGTHTVELTATDEYGNTSSCSFEVTVEETLSNIDYPFNNQTVMLYPNPTDNQVTILNNSGQPILQVVITDVNGRIIDTMLFDESTQNYKVSFEQYAAGVYFVKIFSENQQLVKRVIKK